MFKYWLLCGLIGYILEWVFGYMCWGKKTMVAYTKGQFQGILLPFSIILHIMAFCMMLLMGPLAIVGEVGKFITYRR